MSRMGFGIKEKRRDNSVRCGTASSYEFIRFFGFECCVRHDLSEYALFHPKERTVVSLKLWTTVV